DPEKELRPYVASECVGVGGKKGMGHRMVRTSRWKYVLTDTGEEALFDEEADPCELENLAGVETHHATLQQMRGHMKEWMTRVGDTHPAPPGV
ncbi:MAG TPA: sulfatase, partial [Candidatus Hydrogenedentes bacterium]|nr:sulfatase [Candidatus Hydrogenedentota bacterium]